VDLRRGEPLYMPGDRASSVYLLRAGSVRLSRLMRSGGELILDVVGPGELIGEGAALGWSRRLGLAQALEPSKASPLAASILESAAHRNPDMALALARLVSERQRRLEVRAVLNAYGNCRQKLVGVLLEMAERFGIDEAEGCRIGVRLTHEELARLIGAARETVTPLLVALRRQGAIDYDRSSILLRDRVSLAKANQLPLSA
jgi:CRP/FNR family transcriptional regulator